MVTQFRKETTGEYRCSIDCIQLPNGVTPDSCSQTATWEVENERGGVVVCDEHKDVLAVSAAIVEQ